MTVKRKKISNEYFLECDECPTTASYLPGGNDGWNLNCQHIDNYMIERQEDFSLEEETSYRIFLSRQANLIAADQWVMNLDISLLSQEDGCLPVQMRYTSEVYGTRVRKLGFVLPEDGLSTIRELVWDSLTLEIMELQPELEKRGLVCPMRSHTPESQVKLASDSATTLGINTHAAFIALERCCGYCYRSAMGNDVEKNWGMDDVSPKRGGSRSGTFSATVSPIPGTPTSVVNTSSLTAKSAITKQLGLIGTTAAKNVNIAQSVTHSASAGTHSLKKEDLARIPMSEILNDPDLPF